MELKTGSGQTSTKGVEDLLLGVHRKKRRIRFNGTVRLEYLEGNLKKIKEEVTTHKLSKQITKSFYRGGKGEQ